MLKLNTKPFGRNGRNSISLAPIMASIGQQISPVRVAASETIEGTAMSARFKTPTARRMTFVTEAEEDDLPL